MDICYYSSFLQNMSDEEAKLAKVLGPNKPLQPSLVFQSEAGACRSEEVALAVLANIRLGC